MTYNFDPDQWLETELKVLRRKFEERKISRQQLEASTAELEKKHTEMWDRLDGAYQIH